MKKVILMLAVAAMASCSKSDVETRPVAVSDGDVEIVSGSKVSVITRTPFEGTLDDTSNKSLTAYVMATKLDKDNSNAYLSYAAANLAAEGYMTFVSAASQTSGKYTVDAVGFQNYNTDAVPSLVADPQYYPSNDNALYMVGLVPAKLDDDSTSALQEGWKIDTNGEKASYIIDGKTDIMAAAVTKMNDGSSLIQKSKASASVYPAFDFKHKLTLVNIKAYTPTIKEQEAWGKITKIELFYVYNVTGVHDECEVTLENGNAVVKGAAPNKTTPFYYYGMNTNVTPALEYSDLKISSDDDKTADAAVYYGPVEIPAPASATATDFTATDAQYVAYSMIAPFTATTASAVKCNMKLKVYTEQNEDGIVAIVNTLYDTPLTYDASNTHVTNTDEFNGSTEGKKFDVTLKFIGKEIEASATVTDWEPVYAGEVEVL